MEMKNFFYMLFVILIHQQLISQVRINELECDTPGLDLKEFIELKTETPNTSLDDYVLVFFNGSFAGDDSSYFSLNLDGVISDENGLVLIGSSTMTPFPQLLIPFNAIQNGADAIAIYYGDASDFPEGTKATTTHLIDALVYDTNDSNDQELLNLLGVTNQINEGTSNEYESIQLINNVYEVSSSTPRQLNDGSGVVFNPISISTDHEQYTEGDSIEITFTSQSQMIADTNFSFTLENHNFNSSDYSGSTSVTMPSGQNSVTTIIHLANDGLNEGDEELVIKFENLESPLIPFNNLIKLRVIDSDYIVAPYGRPTHPTYGIVQNTKPIGYYNSLEGKSGVQLRQAMQDLVSRTEVVRAHSYRDIITILKEADVDPANSNQVWLLYTEQGRAKLDIQTSSDNIGKWNREHTFPRSHANYDNIDDDNIADGIDVFWETEADSLRHGNSDAHALRAADGPENSLRSNRFYGEYQGPLSGVGSFKGDVARGVFFMDIRYNGLEVVHGFPELRLGKTGDLATLLEWHRNDPPDDFEMHRNNVIYNWQKNRNPFIDQPDLVEYIWGNNVGDSWQVPLSIENFLIGEEIAKLFPNPIQDKLYVSGKELSYSVALWSFEGRLLKKEIVKNNDFIKLDFSSGLYIVKVTSKEGKMMMRKVVID